MGKSEKKNTLLGSRALGMLYDRLRSGTLGELWRDWLWIWQFSARRWKEILGYTLLGILVSGVGLVNGIAGKYMIDSVISLDLQRLKWMLVLVLAGTAVLMVIRGVSSWFSARLSISMQNDVQAQVFDALLGSDWLALNRFSTGELMNRFGGDASTVAKCAVSWLSNVAIQLFTLLATLGVILYYDPILALLGCISAPVMLLSSRRLMAKQRDFNRRTRQAAGGLYAFQEETFRNLDTLKSFGVEGQTGSRLRQLQEGYKKLVMEFNLFSIKTGAWLSALGTAVQYIAMGYCVWRMWRGELLFGSLVLFLQLRGMLQSAFSALVSSVPMVLSGSVSAERLREVMELEKEPASEPVHPVGSCAIRVEGVTAGYGQGEPVLQNVSMVAEPGAVTALVGPSGEGKTTMLRLLLGLLRPQSGILELVDETETVYPLGSTTRRCFCYVPQGSSLMAGTVADNLRLRKPDATREEMEAALKDACAWDFVSRMPQGMDSPLGEGGRGLSQGQAQRIAIARALLYQAPAMLLDEVTSALDVETEQQVLHNLTRRGITCVVTTHRPSVLGMCDRVYRIQEGQMTRLGEAEIQALTALWQ